MTVTRFLRSQIFLGTSVWLSALACSSSSPPSGVGGGSPSGGGSASGGAGPAVGGSLLPGGGSPSGGAEVGQSGGALSSGGGTPSGGGQSETGGASLGGSDPGSGGAPPSGGGPSGGTGGGTTNPVFACPSGSSSLAPKLGTATKLSNPPDNPPNIQGSTFYLEGPVYSNGKVYLSQFRDYSQPNEPSPGRIVAFDIATKTYAEIAPDAGTNGLALAAPNLLFGASLKVGGVVKIDIASTPATVTTLVADYMGKRLNSPNDLTIGADGTVYFTDPDWNCTSPCSQDKNRVYRYPASGDRKLVEIPTPHAKPNGISLSPDGKTLYIGGDANLVSAPVMADGTVGAATKFADVSGTDGSAIDCAGNLYAVAGTGITVLSPSGSVLGTIPVTDSTSNVAFGGPNATTLYITTLRSGLYTLDVGIPGFPY